MINIVLRVLMFVFLFVSNIKVSSAVVLELKLKDFSICKFQKNNSLKIDSSFIYNKNYIVSKELEKLIQILKQDNYIVNVNKNKSDFILNNYDQEFNIKETIKFDRKFITEIHVKRKHKIIRMQESFYPSFTIFEFRIQNKEKLALYYHKIKNIIDSTDNLNEKLYDYVIFNRKSILYIRCQVKLFEKFALFYKNIFEKLIREGYK